MQMLTENIEFVRKVVIRPVADTNSYRNEYDKTTNLERVIRQCDELDMTVSSIPHLHSTLLTGLLEISMKTPVTYMELI